LGWLTFGYGFISLLYPLAAGFALLGPFAAIGLYELIRRRGRGLAVDFTQAFDVLHSLSSEPDNHGGLRLTVAGALVLGSLPFLVGLAAS
jgi:uncharacterized membrane protein